jgi:protein-S-isoprenylcysteine O-methyltransferase Ste14
MSNTWLVAQVAVDILYAAVVLFACGGMVASGMAARRRRRHHPQASVLAAHAVADSLSLAMIACVFAAMLFDPQSTPTHRWIVGVAFLAAAVVQATRAIRSRCRRPTDTSPADEAGDDANL